jgi:hypothetical protein
MITVNITYSNGTKSSLTFKYLSEALAIRYHLNDNDSFVIQEGVVILATGKISKYIPTNLYN